MDNLMIKIQSNEYVGSEEYIQLELENIPNIVGRFITTKQILLPESEKDLELIKFFYSDVKENIINFSNSVLEYCEFLQMNIPKGMQKIIYIMLIEYLEEIYDDMKSINLIDTNNMQYKKKLNY